MDDAFLSDPLQDNVEFIRYFLGIRSERWTLFDSNASDLCSSLGRILRTSLEDKDWSVCLLGWCLSNPSEVRSIEVGISTFSGSSQSNHLASSVDRSIEIRRRADHQRLISINLLDIFFSAVVVVVVYLAFYFLSSLPLVNVQINIRMRSVVRY